MVVPAVCARFHQGSILLRRPFLSSPLLMQQRSFAESATMETNPLLQKLDVVSSFEKAIDLIDVRSVFISVKDRDTKRDLLKTTSGY